MATWPSIAVSVSRPVARSTVTNPPRTVAYTAPAPLPAIAAAPAGSITGRTAPVGPTIVRVPGACGSVPGVNTTSEDVAVSNNAAVGRPPSASTSPTGGRSGGGDAAAPAGSMVAGPGSVSFDEHPASSDTARSSANASIPDEVVRATRCGRCGTRWPPGSIGHSTSGQWSMSLILGPGRTRVGAGIAHPLP